MHTHTHTHTHTNVLLRILIYFASKPLYDSGTGWKHHHVDVDLTLLFPDADGPFVAMPPTVVPFKPLAYLKLEDVRSDELYLFMLKATPRKGRMKAGYVAYYDGEYIDIDLDDNPRGNIYAFKMDRPHILKVLLRQDIRSLKHLDTLLTERSFPETPLVRLAYDLNGDKFPAKVHIDHVGGLPTSFAVCHA